MLVSECERGADKWQNLSRFQWCHLPAIIVIIVARIVIGHTSLSGDYQQPRIKPILARASNATHAHRPQARVVHLAFFIPG